MKTPQFGVFKTSDSITIIPTIRIYREGGIYEFSELNIEWLHIGFFIRFEK